jgi:YVTN family beta-propeller protein
MEAIPKYRGLTFMKTLSGISVLVLAITFGLTSHLAVAQVVVATVPAGNIPFGVAVNSVTNKTYVANYSDSTVTVIDGASNNTTTVNVGLYPAAIAVNAVTNRIYVANRCGNDSSCNSAGTVSVIDGTSNTTASVNVGYAPVAVAVNSATNQIYVVNECGNDPTCSSPGTVTVVDGSSNKTTTVMVGTFPYDVEINPVTNQIYVVNDCGDDNSCNSVGTVTVIDGVNNKTTTVNVGFYPYFAAVNSVTNKIYVANKCGNDVNCGSVGTVTVIDGATNGATAVIAGFQADTLALNSVTNKIYVENDCGNDFNCASNGTVTVIEGATNNTATVSVGVYPYGVAVNAATNKTYVANYCGNDLMCNSAGTVTVIDGASNTTVPVAVADGPESLAVNAASDKIYVPNYGDATVSVIGGNASLQLVAVPPCRLLDTRPGNGNDGAIQGGTVRTFNLPQLAQQQGCADLSTAAAYSLNVAVVPHGPLDYLTVWPAGQSQPLVATLNSYDGRVKANAAIVPAGVSGAVSFYATDTTDLILDIDGYFTLAGSSTLAFYTLPPCRVVDTRGAPADLGGPYLKAGVPRDFPVLEAASCNIPNSAQAYSMNFAVVPHGPLGYLTVWPTGQNQPLVSTLNAYGGQVTANAAIVPAGRGGEISTFAYNDTDLVVDIDGYFAPPGPESPLSLYPSVPCRVLDTRHGSGAFNGMLGPPVDVLSSVCGLASQSQAYVFNATVVPQGSLGYLTLWPDGITQPLVSTLNAYDGAVTSNMAIVPAGTDGKVDAYAYGLTNLILDISSYFAP